MIDGMPGAAEANAAIAYIVNHASVHQLRDVELWAGRPGWVPIIADMRWSHQGQNRGQVAMGWLKESELFDNPAKGIMEGMLSIAASNEGGERPGVILSMFPLLRLDEVQQADTVELTATVGLLMGRLKTPDGDEGPGWFGLVGGNQTQEAMRTGNDTNRFTWAGRSPMKEVKAKEAMMDGPLDCTCDEDQLEGGDTPCAWCMGLAGVDL